MDSRSAAVVLANLCTAAAASNASRQAAASPTARWTVCLYCNRTLLESELYGHVAAHIGYRPFTCGYCMAEFTARAELVSHTAREHLGCALKYDEDRSDYKQKLVDKIVSDCIRGAWIPDTAPRSQETIPSPNRSQETPEYRSTPLQPSDEAGSSSRRIVEYQPSLTDSNSNASDTPRKKRRGRPRKGVLPLAEAEHDVELVGASGRGERRIGDSPARVDRAEVTTLRNNPRLPSRKGDRSLYQDVHLPSSPERAKIPNFSPAANSKTFSNTKCLTTSATAGKTRSLPATPRKTGAAAALTPRKRGIGARLNFLTNSVARNLKKHQKVIVGHRKSTRVPPIKTKLLPVSRGTLFDTKSPKIVKQESRRNEQVSTSGTGRKARSLPGTPQKAGSSAASTPRKQSIGMRLDFLTKSVDQKWKKIQKGINQCRNLNRVPMKTEVVDDDQSINKKLDTKSIADLERSKRKPYEPQGSSVQAGMSSPVGNGVDLASSPFSPEIGGSIDFVDESGSGVKTAKLSYSSKNAAVGAKDKNSTAIGDEARLNGSDDVKGNLLKPVQAKLKETYPALKPKPRAPDAMKRFSTSDAVSNFSNPGPKKIKKEALSTPQGPKKKWVSNERTPLRDVEKLVVGSGTGVARPLLRGGRKRHRMNYNEDELFGLKHYLGPSAWMLSGDEEEEPEEKPKARKARKAVSSKVTKPQVARKQKKEVTGLDQLRKQRCEKAFVAKLLKKAKQQRQRKPHKGLSQQRARSMHKGGTGPPDAK